MNEKCLGSRIIAATVLAWFLTCPGVGVAQATQVGEDKPIALKRFEAASSHPLSTSQGTGQGSGIGSQGPNDVTAGGDPSQQPQVSDAARPWRTDFVALAAQQQTAASTGAGGGDDPDTSTNYVEDINLGIGIGKYGLFGAEVNVRASDELGISAGAGAQYYQIEYVEFDGLTARRREDTGFAAVGGVKGHYYFTPRTQPDQHNLFGTFQYGRTFGPAFGFGYGYERHRAGRGGWNFSIGLIFAPDAESHMEDFLDVDEIDDFLWIPVLIELGVMF